MKYISVILSPLATAVAPLVGAWIEIYKLIFCASNNKVAPLVGAWIEIRETFINSALQSVAPLVGAWIEIGYKGLWE